MTESTTFPPDAGDVLLPVARGAIETRLAGTRTAQISVDAIRASGLRPPWLRAPGASFVTLTLDSHLRGCIGTLSAHRPLDEDVAHNAIAAALHDPRFAPVSEAELERILIEVSVLSERHPLPFDTEASVRDALRPGIDGVVLQAGPYNHATFLPQVWGQLPDPAAFLTALKTKAGLAESWWSEDAHIETYTVATWSESDALAQ